MDAQDAAEWLREIQAARGIRYTADDLEPRLRFTFAQMVAGIPDATGDVSGIVYTGFRSQKMADGTEWRTELKKLHGRVVLPDGRAYAVTLEGEYGR